VLEKTVYGLRHSCRSAGESHIPIPISSHCCLNIPFLFLHFLLFLILSSTGIERTEFRSHTYLLINHWTVASPFQKNDHTKNVFQYRKPPMVQHIATGRFLLHQRRSEIKGIALNIQTLLLYQKAVFKRL
jgi:hypothetical protein